MLDKEGVVMATGTGRMLDLCRRQGGHPPSCAHAHFVRAPRRPAEGRSLSLGEFHNLPEVLPLWKQCGKRPFTPEQRGPPTALSIPFPPSLSTLRPQAAQNREQKRRDDAPKPQARLSDVNAQDARSAGSMSV